MIIDKKNCLIFILAGAPCHFCLKRQVVNMNRPEKGSLIFFNVLCHRFMPVVFEFNAMGVGGIVGS